MYLHPGNLFHTVLESASSSPEQKIETYSHVYILHVYTHACTCTVHVTVISQTIIKMSN